MRLAPAASRGYQPVRAWRAPSPLVASRSLLPLVAVAPPLGVLRLDAMPAPHFRPDRPLRGTREIRVILYANADLFCATALADELSVEDILAIEHDVIPLDGTDVF